MAFSTVLYDRLRELLPSATHPAKRMFGGVVFFHRGHMLVGVFGDGMMVRVAAADGDLFLRESGIRPLASNPRRMQGFLVVEEHLLDRDEDISTWIDRAMAYNQTLPAK